jgi:Tol biopolymer transport system component
MRYVAGGARGLGVGTGVALAIGALGVPACGGGGGPTSGSPPAVVFSHALVAEEGRYLAFDSDDPEIVAADANEEMDVFRRDLETGETLCASVSSDGTLGNVGGILASVSADGRYVVYESFSDNLVEDDTNEASDVFVHDFETGETTRVSVDSAGGQAFDGGFFPTMSRDGRYVAFESWSADLVGEDLETYYVGNVFVHDRETGETTRVSVDSAGDPLPGDCFSPLLSPDGRWVVFVSGWDGDGDSVLDEDALFLRDLENGTTTFLHARPTVAYDYWDDVISHTAFAPGGRYLVFECWGGIDDLFSTAVFVHDLEAGATTLESADADGVAADGESQVGAITSDGAWVVFESDAPNLPSGADDGLFRIYRRDRETGEVEVASVAGDGTLADDDSWGATISADGRFVAFESYATTLVAGDLNESPDVFVHDFDTGATVRVSVASDGSEADLGGFVPAISADGRYVTFQSESTNLLGGGSHLDDEDWVFRVDFYVHDLVTGETYLAGQAP